MKKKIQFQNTSITAIILTYNEEINIKNCINSIKNIVNEIIVIDSFSSDRTLAICKKFKNVKIFQRRFENQADQMNWALRNIKINSQWVFRIDADEYLEKISNKNLIKLLTEKKNYNGIILKRKIKFLRKVINYGLTSPHYTLRLWKVAKGFYPNITMDEQVNVKGKVFVSDLIIIDNNLKGIFEWFKKHINYAKREANQYINGKNYVSKKKDRSKLNKINKINLYYNLPILIRPILLFLYSYIFKKGFLSGYQGLIFYFFQNLIYRILVDINIIILKLNKKN